VEGELQDLATEAAAVLMEGLSSEGWRQVRDRYRAWFQHYGRSGHAQELALLGEKMERHAEGSMSERRWRNRLHVGLAATRSSSAQLELRFIIAEFTAPANPADRPLTTDPVLSALTGTATDPVPTGTLESVSADALDQAGPIVPRGVAGPLLASQDHLDFRQGTFNGQFVGVQHNHYPSDRPARESGTSAPESWPSVEDVDPLALGVRPTRRFDGESERPPYVQRDVDERLEALVYRGGLLVVTGEPLSGKSDTASAAIHGALDLASRIYAPAPGTDLRGLPALLHGREGSYVLWLDELEGHLGENGLDMALLSRLTRLCVPVVATMNDEAYDAHRFGKGPESRVLRRAERVELPRRWSEAELARLARFKDPRLTDALKCHDNLGIAEYLAAEPELWDEWRRARRATAHPRGHLLVRAAIDLGRCGLDGPVPLELLRDVHEEYASEIPERDWEPFDDALEWATAKSHRAIGLLVPGDKAGTWRACGPLVAAALRSAEMPPVPDGVVHWLFGVVQDYEARDRDAVTIVTASALAQRASEGDAGAMFMLGVLKDGTSDDEASLDWYRRAAEAGNPMAMAVAGFRLAARGDDSAAIPLLEAAAEAGDPVAAGRLGHLLRERSEHWLNVAAKAGVAEAAYELGDLLMSPYASDRIEAENWHQVAAAAQDALARLRRPSLRQSGSDTAEE